VAAALPEAGSRERDEIDDLSRTFAAAGFDLQLSNEGSSWVAALRRHGSLLPAGASYAIGSSPVEATRAAWQLYVTVPSLNSIDPPRLRVSDLLAAWVSELAARRRGVDRRNARALEALADHLLDPPAYAGDRAREVERLADAFEARTFPQPETLQALLQHRATRPQAQEALLLAMIRAESRG
jgi:hypothetical protein